MHVTLPFACDSCVLLTHLQNFPACSASVSSFVREFVLSSPRQRTAALSNLWWTLARCLVPLTPVTTLPCLDWMSVLASPNISVHHAARFMSNRESFATIRRCSRLSKRSSFPAGYSRNGPCRLLFGRLVSFAHGDIGFKFIVDA